MFDEQSNLVFSPCFFLPGVYHWIRSCCQAKRVFSTNQEKPQEIFEVETSGWPCTAFAARKISCEPKKRRLKAIVDSERTTSQRLILLPGRGSKYIKKVHANENLIPVE